MIVVDLDGTIADCSHRLHYIQGETKDWDSFYKACIDDKPIQDVIDIINTLEEYYDVVFLTGRSEICRQETIDWLDKHVSVFVYRDAVLMRKEGDFRPDDIVKPELLNQFLESKFFDTDVHTIFEDRNSMVKKWRELGYTCFQVAEGDF